MTLGLVTQDRGRHLCCRYGSLRSALLPSTKIPPSAFPGFIDDRGTGATGRLSTEVKRTAGSHEGDKCPVAPRRATSPEPVCDVTQLEEIR